MSRNFFKLWFAFVMLCMIGGVIWQITMYNECKKDGYSTFFCMSMTSKGQYVIVDQFQDHNP